MEQKQRSRYRQAVKRNEPEIRGLLTAHAVSSLTVKEFCQQNNIAEWAFYAWKKKYGSSVKRQDGAGFVSLQVQETAQPTFSSQEVLFAEVIGEKGRCIRLFQQVPPSYLQTLLS